MSKTGQEEDAAVLRYDVFGEEEGGKAKHQFECNLVKRFSSTFPWPQKNNLFFLFQSKESTLLNRIQRL